MNLNTQGLIIKGYWNQANNDTTNSNIGDVRSLDKCSRRAEFKVQETDIRKIAPYSPESKYALGAIADTAWKKAGTGAYE